MKIERTNKYIDFFEINEAQVFEYSGRVYIKLEKNEKANAVHLETGISVVFNGNDKVIQHENARLII